MSSSQRFLRFLPVADERMFELGLLSDEAFITQLKSLPINSMPCAFSTIRSNKVFINGGLFSFGAYPFSSNAHSPSIVPLIITYLPSLSQNDASIQNWTKLCIIQSSVSDRSFLYPLISGVHRQIKLLLLSWVSICDRGLAGILILVVSILAHFNIKPS